MDIFMHSPPYTEDRVVSSPIASTKMKRSVVYSDFLPGATSTKNVLVSDFVSYETCDNNFDGYTISSGKKSWALGT
jgi:hypothetical protein